MILEADKSRKSEEQILEESRAHQRGGSDPRYAEIAMMSSYVSLATGFFIGALVGMIIGRPIH